MKLYYIDQRKLFSFLQPVEVWDEQGNVRYRLKSKSTVGYQLRLLTPYDEEVASMSNICASQSPYHVCYLFDSLIASIKDFVFRWGFISTSIDLIMIYVDNFKP